MQVLIEETGEDGHDGNTPAHRHRGVDGLQADHFAALAGGDIAHRRQMTHRKGPAVKDLREDKPRQRCGPAHQRPANQPAQGREQQQIPRAKAAEHLFT